MSHVCIAPYKFNKMMSVKANFSNTKAIKEPIYTFKEPTVAVSGISMKSSGTMKDLILSFTAQEKMMPFKGS